MATRTNWSNGKGVYVMKCKDAVKNSMELLATNPMVRFIGYNLKYGSKSYGSLTNIDPNIIIETPVAEQLMSGLAIGMALEGFLPVMIFERHDFLLLATDQLINHLSKIKLMSQGEFTPRIIIRAIVGGTKPFHPGPQHIQDFTDIFKVHSTFHIFEPQNAKEIKEAYINALQLSESSFIVEKRDEYSNE